MNKVALVTGGSRGIGFGIASALAAEKWDIVINGIRPEEAVAEPLDKLRAFGVRVGYARGDIGSPEGRASILAATRGYVAAWSKEQGAGSSEPVSSHHSSLVTHHSINLLVNNAGVAPKVRADLLDTSEESYDHVLGTNLRGDLA